MRKFGLAVILILFSVSSAQAGGQCSQSHIPDPVQLGFLAKLQIFVARRIEARHSYRVWAIDESHIAADLQLLQDLRVFRLADRNDFIFVMIERYGKTWLKQAKEIQASVPISERDLDQATLSSARIVYLQNQLEYLKAVQDVLLRLKKNVDRDAEGFRTWMELQMVKLELIQMLGFRGKRTAQRVLEESPNRERILNRRAEIDESLREVQDEIDLFLAEQAHAMASP